MDVTVNSDSLVYELCDYLQVTSLGLILSHLMVDVMWG